VIVALYVLVAGDVRSEDILADIEKLGAHDAVHEGNVRLLEGDSEWALKAYDHAGKLEPDALEIPFSKGIGHLNLKQYDEARRAFEKAALSRNKALAADAMYGIGAAHHAEALSKMTNPQEALPQLEDAMQQYRRTLADYPDHRASREANAKAARMWRKVREQLQQQQQQQQSKDENKPEDKENQDQQEQQPSDDQKQQESDEHQQEQQQDGQPLDKKDEQQAQQSEQEQENEEQQQQAKSEEQKDEERQAAQAKEEDRNSQEQADRRLREMMQMLKNRQKTRKEKIEKAPVRPVDKDW
jgi:Ca-activated chloride channel family protein